MNDGKLRAKLYFLNSIFNTNSDRGNGVRKKVIGESLEKIRQTLTCKYCRRVFRKRLVPKTKAMRKFRR
jgi:hypothetical protein